MFSHDKLRSSPGLLSTLLLAFGLANAESPLNFDFPYNATEPVPFRASVYPSFVNETRLKASLYRPVIDLLDYEHDEPSFKRGRSSTDMKSLAATWTDDYDWYAAEDEIFSDDSHYAVTVPGGAGFDHPVPFHFIHERSDNEDAIPLLMLHGWPSTHMEWSKVIGPLADGSNSQAFHVVAPDLPGFGFSPAPEYSGLGAYQLGAALDNLMKKLGYEKYGVASTDLGWFIALAMANQSPDSFIGHYSDFWFVEPNEDDLARLARNETTAEETAYITSFNTFVPNFYNFGPPNAQSPVAIAQAMTDSPVGFGGWLWHAFDIVGDGYDFTNDEIITQTMMLFIQGTYGGMRLYTPIFEQFRPNIPKAGSVPSGAGIWGAANSPFHQYYPATTLCPRSWTERVANVTYYNKHEFGGHFPAHDVPQEYVEDVRAFFGSL